MENHVPITAYGRYLYAFKAVLDNEGGYSNQVLDDGGPTNFGITQRELTRIWRADNLPPDVKNLTQDDAEKYYKIEWWDKYHFDAINSLPIATKLFDMAVNMGPLHATKLIQRACNWCGHNLAEDGVIGPKTFYAINDICLHNRQSDLMQELMAEQLFFYEDLVAKNPKLKVFLKGWMNRAAFNPS
jgi:lysozyme family protein